MRSREELKRDIVAAIDLWGSGVLAKASRAPGSHPSSDVSLVVI